MFCEDFFFREKDVLDAVSFNGPDIFFSPVVIYFYSANTRINLTCPECS